MTPARELAGAMRDVLFDAMAPGESLFAILDAAQNHEIPLRLRAARVEHDCLYQGPTAEALWYVAPYALRCERDSTFLAWVLQQGWGSSWGIFLTASVDLATLRQHVRRFLIVKAEASDEDLYFRFYDPRVLREFLPTCAPEETSEFFGPVRRFLVENEQSDGLLEFTATQMGAKQNTIRPRSEP
jgi:Domain of unknown function (DUF4123)